MHRRYVAKVFPGDLYGDRRRALQLTRRQDYNRILDVGASSGHHTAALTEVFPEAKIYGIDPSPRMLEQAQRVANENGWPWKLFVGVGEAMPFPDESFDLVTAYSVHHELPRRIIERINREAFRVLKPGGDVLFIDSPRTHHLTPMAAWGFDWIARWSGEPYWRAACEMNWEPSARDAGFVDVETQKLPPQNRTISQATKPRTA